MLGAEPLQSSVGEVMLGELTPARAGATLQPTGRLLNPLGLW